MFGKCRGCGAKEEEIRHLLGLLQRAQDLADKAQSRLAEVVSPGTERRMVVALKTPATPAQEAASIADGRRPKPLASSFPGYQPREVPAPPPIDDGSTEGAA